MAKKDKKPKPKKAKTKKRKISRKVLLGALEALVTVTPAGVKKLRPVINDILDQSEAGVDFKTTEAFERFKNERLQATQPEA